MIFWGNIIWALIIFIFCAMPQKDIPDPHLNIPHLDKVVHFGMFFIMSLLLSFLLESQTDLRLKTIYTMAVSAAFLYGGLIEILQYHFFNRSGDVWDLLADIAGGIAGCLAHLLVKHVLCRQRE